MGLLVVYVVLVFVGQAVAVMIGIFLDTISKSLGLAVFLGLYFVVFVVCWNLAVRLTNRGGLLHARFGR